MATPGRKKTEVLVGCFNVAFSPRSNSRLSNIMKLIYPSLLLVVLTLATTALGRTIPNFAEADLVLGQTNFNSAVTPSPPTGTSLLLPAGVVVDPVTRKVFVADAFNFRILRYASADTLTNGAPAEFAFGQLTFTDKTNFLSNGITPVGLFFDRRGRLWVADPTRHRVLMFEAASTRTNWIADKIFGQPDFATITPGTARGKMKFPYDVCVDAADRLWVADKENNRVLRFDSISGKGTGAEADGVLGQASFTTDTLVGGQSGLPSPVGVTVSASGALFVSSGGLNRVLRFDNAASLSFVASASAVLGQPDFTTYSGGTTASKMDYTGGVWITQDDSLWVADGGNSRVLRFSNASTKPSGAAADGVLGQPDFTTKDPATTRRGLNVLEFKPFVDTTGSLWLPDSNQLGSGGNNRVLRFPAVISLPVVGVTTPLKKPVAKPKLTLKGTASDPNGISLVQYRVGNGPLLTASGTTVWQITTKLKKGKNFITVIATDPWGDVSQSKLITIRRK
jgi:sugar lactone lactonase YvrE